MSSRSHSQSSEERHDPPSEHETKEEDAEMSDSVKQPHPHSNTKTPEPRIDQLAANTDTPSTPGVLAPFDWDDFEARYEKALFDADEHEREILKEAENLSKYFRVWASAASSHDDERAIKRLQTRQRYVNLSEEKMEQKQQHYDEVVRAFESALALLKSK
ncbi:Fc.00g021110.m01.CDS01 [Cosmosporella sp. VM-42]